jgi:sec-independent protein translocase protein TatB
MFDIGWSELLVIAVVAIVVVGPKELPKLMRGFGHYAGKLRRAAAEFQRQFEDAMREAEIDEVKKAIESVRTEATNLDAPAPMDKRFMPQTPEPRPELVAPAHDKAAPAPEPKPAPVGPAPDQASPPAKPKRKRAAPKAKSPGKGAKSGAASGA